MRKTNTSQKRRTSKTAKTAKNNPLLLTIRRRPLLAAVALSAALLLALPGGWLILHGRNTPVGSLAAEVAGSSPLKVTDKRTSSQQTVTSEGAGSKTGGGTGSSGSRAAQGQAVKKAAVESQKKSSGQTASAAATGSNKAAPTASAKPAAPAPPAPAPAPAPAPTPAPSGWHDNIITTVFWVGEAASAENAGISNAESAWDGNWQSHYGGFDDPDHRNGYYPAGFTPKENPFYFALPYNDLAPNGRRKATAGNCPNTGSPISWCKNAWIKVSFNGKVAYAQWQDVGPMLEDDVNYVFGTARPSNTWGARAGLDVSPAMRDYLGLSGVDRTSWSFVPASQVPAGPWRNIITTGLGGW